MPDPEGLIYSGRTSDGVIHIGFLARDDDTDYTDPQNWHPALDVLRDPPGLRIDSIKRARMSEFVKLAKLPL